MLSVIFMYTRPSACIQYSAVDSLFISRHCGEHSPRVGRDMGGLQRADIFPHASTDRKNTPFLYTAWNDLKHDDHIIIRDSRVLFVIIIIVPLLLFFSRFSYPRLSYHRDQSSIFRRWLAYILVPYHLTHIGGFVKSYHISTISYFFYRPIRIYGENIILFLHL